VQRLSVLLVVTFRPEFRPLWIGKPHVTTLILNRLDPRDCAALAELVAHGKSLPPEVLNQIVARTDGVPLFVEELTKTVLESSLLREENSHYVLDGPLLPLAIPTSLHASLMARLDRLASVREVAQMGAAIGREFSYELLALLTPLPDEQLRQALEQLASTEFVFSRGAPPGATYTFKHALVQDAAYSTLLRSTRQQLHTRIVNVLEAQFPDTAATQPELLMHHCTQGGLTAKAAGYGHRAGEMANRRGAMTEALSHFNKALRLLASQPESTERDQQEFRLQLARGGVLAASRGWASPQMGEAYSRACKLLRLVEGVPELEQITALNGLWVFHHNRAELDAADEAAGELQRLAERRQGAAVLMLAHRASGTNLMYRGEFKAALEHLDLVLIDSDPTIDAAIYFAVANAPVSALSFMAWIRLFQGHLEDAVACIGKALNRAQELSNPYGSAFSLHVNCLFNQVRRDWRAVQEQSALLVALAAEQGFPHFVAMGTFFQGWAAFTSGDTETGIALMKQGLAAKRAGGAEIQVPYYLGLLADAYRQVRPVPDALPLLTDALDRMERTGERWFEAELHRMKAEVLMALAPPRDAATEAEASLHRALEVAHTQGAKLWELRASTSLAQLWSNQGRRVQARCLLAPIFGWFVEGLDTPDLDAAGAVLHTLN